MVEHFGIDKGAVSRQLQHLVDLGLVERTPGPGRRPGHPGGRERRRDPAARRRHRAPPQVARRALGDWTAEELEEFVNGLERYNVALNA